MPSWNIHTAHVERLLAEHRPADLGISDANVFLFGNYVPDIYLGFMVHNTTFRLDYCLTHFAQPNRIPIPNADRFWNDCVWRIPRRPKTDEGLSLALGTWAHLMADRMYNMRFRAFCQTRVVPGGEELRMLKQADFHLFGSALKIGSHVEVTPALLRAAEAFRPYSILEPDVRGAVDVADAMFDTSTAVQPAGGYQLLKEGWLDDTFDACNERLGVWLSTYRQLQQAGEPFTAEDIRANGGLSPAKPDDLTWDANLK